MVLGCVAQAFHTKNLLLYKVVLIQMEKGFA